MRLELVPSEIRVVRGVDKVVREGLCHVLRHDCGGRRVEHGVGGRCHQLIEHNMIKCMSNTCQIHVKYMSNTRLILCIYQKISIEIDIESISADGIKRQL